MTETEEKYEFTAGAKKRLYIWGAIGVVLLILGVVVAMNSGHHGEEGSHGEGHGEES